ncbi:hypothetical protein [Polycladidibacter stylochi]|uniref:hypothetical protein n=1 Tax=Polycladidibacter stylochi TaxID=1807766 RepID=UPI0008357FE9|nr:hypothetical protein [Pseudovibrio stylochi]
MVDIKLSFDDNKLTEFWKVVEQFGPLFDTLKDIAKNSPLSQESNMSLPYSSRVIDKEAEWCPSTLAEKL